MKSQSERGTRAQRGSCEEFGLSSLVILILNESSSEEFVKLLNGGHGQEVDDYLNQRVSDGKETTWVVE